MFTHNKKWIEEVNMRVLRRTITEGILSVILIVSAVITENALVYIGAGIIIVLFVSDLYFAPKRKEHIDAHSVEVTDNGLIIRNLNHNPICLNWKNIEIHSRLISKNKLESITLKDNSGIGKVVLEGLENIDSLDSMIKEKISDL